MGKSLVIVESPAKARTIARYLGPDFEVESSVGHVRDLPGRASDIPSKYKGEAWSRLGVNVDSDFEPLYIVPPEKKQQVKKLKDLLKGADELLLATDEDREGEAIAWHLKEVLKPKVPVKRMVFGEITRAAIEKSVEATREIDERLVDAQEARRLLDRLYGYEVSPMLWRKVRPRLSAGRVQSVATRLVVDRERARMRFVVAEYWDLRALLVGGAEEVAFEARLAELNGARVASGRDFGDETGSLTATSEAMHLGEERARALAAGLAETDFEVTRVREKPFTRKPYPPFTTSTLQQEASRKLRFSAQRTMRIAQGLYENGYITYMRTDSRQLSNEALQAARGQVSELYGDEFLPESPRTFGKSAPNAQEAHEAIRPAGERFRSPDAVRGELDSDGFRLYELIWKRTLASQMKDARGLSTTARLEATAGEDRVAFQASGRVLQFPGFLRVYVEGSDDPEAELEDQERFLPMLQEEQVVKPREVEALGHSTQPPPRFTEASLVKELEERGIGRPSTYATILQTIQDRGYVWKRGGALVPTFTAFAVTKLLEQHLGSLVDFEFTARMEGDLDAIARGERQAVPYLASFYFGDDDGGSAPREGGKARSPGLKELIGSGWDEIDARAICSLPLGEDGQGVPVNVRVGRYGPYVEAGERRATLRDDIAPDELSLEVALELLSKADEGDREVGVDPRSGLTIYVKSGRFGDYVQLGEREKSSGSGKKKSKSEPKPKMASLWPEMDAQSLDLEQALLLLSFPRHVGDHPETGDAITAQDGRFGPYLKMGTDSRSLDDHEQMSTVSLEEAVRRFQEPRGRRRSAAVLAELGQHPESDAPVVLKSGRFGPYVTDGVVNASVPKGRDPESVSLQDAVELIAKREQKLREQGKDPRAKATKKKVSKKSTKKKVTKKKKATKKTGSAGPRRKAS